MVDQCKTRIWNEGLSNRNNGDKSWAPLQLWRAILKLVKEPNSSKSNTHFQCFIIIIIETYY